MSFLGPSSELLNLTVVPGSLEVAPGVISYGFGTLEFAFGFRSDSRLGNFRNSCSGPPHCSWNKTWASDHSTGGPPCPILFCTTFCLTHYGKPHCSFICLLNMITVSFKKSFICIFGWAQSLLHLWMLSLAMVNRRDSSLWCMRFSSRWTLCYGVQAVGTRASLGMACVP